MSGEEQTIDLIVSATDERGAVAAGLDAVLDTARPASADPRAAAGTAATAIRGQGADLGVLFFELANDLLAHLDEGGEVGSVRLDGLLRTGDGYSAWGYALGEPATAGPPIALILADVPIVERATGDVTLRIRLRHG